MQFFTMTTAFFEYGDNLYLVHRPHFLLFQTLLLAQSDITQSFALAKLQTRGIINKVDTVCLPLAGAQGKQRVLPSSGQCSNIDCEHQTSFQTGFLSERDDKLFINLPLSDHFHRKCIYYFSCRA